MGASIALPRKCKGVNLSTSESQSVLSSFRGAPGAVVESPSSGPGSPDDKPPNAESHFANKQGGATQQGDNNVIIVFIVADC